MKSSFELLKSLITKIISGTNLDNEKESITELKNQFHSKIASAKNNKNLLFPDSIEAPNINKTTKNILKNLPLNKSSKSSRNFKNNSFKKIKTKTQMTFYQTCSDLITVYSDDSNKLNELLKKFNSITITKIEITDFISSLLSKLDFLGDQLNFFHFKELNLENKKSQ